MMKTNKLQLAYLLPDITRYMAYQLDYSLHQRLYGQLTLRFPNKIQGHI